MANYDGVTNLEKCYLKIFNEATPDKCTHVSENVQPNRNRRSYIQEFTDEYEKQNSRAIWSINTDTSQ